MSNRTLIPPQSRLSPATAAGPTHTARQNLPPGIWVVYESTEWTGGNGSDYVFPPFKVRGAWHSHERALRDVGAFLAETRALVYQAECRLQTVRLNRPGDGKGWLLEVRQGEGVDAGEYGAGEGAAVGLSLSEQLGLAMSEGAGVRGGQESGFAFEEPIGDEEQEDGEEGDEVKPAVDERTVLLRAMIWIDFVKFRDSARVDEGSSASGDGKGEDRFEGTFGDDDAVIQSEQWELEG